MKNPLVTVYIPNRNYGRFLSQAIDSVLNQSLQDWELFLVDEASEDDSLEIMRRYVDLNDERIKMIAHQEPMGLQKTANEVLGLARGKYFIRLDADDWFDEAALLILVNKLESDERLGIVWGNYYYTNIDGRVLGVELANKPGVGRVSPHSAPHGAATMVRTRTLKATGGYSEDVNAQDGWDLWYKLLKQVDAASVSTPVFYYRQHGNSLSRNSERLLAARTRIFEKLASQLESSYVPSALAVIAVREDYPDNSGVPYQTIKGVSLLEHAIATTLESGRATEVMVSSRSEAVLEFSEKLEREGRVGAHMRRLRNTTEVDGGPPVDNILLDAGRFYHEERGHFPDIVTFCNIHSVHRTGAHLDKALNVLRINCTDSVVSVQEEREVLFTVAEKGLSVLNPGRLQALSFERERVFCFNGALIAVWWEVLEAGSLLGESIGFIEMTEAESRRFIQASERFSQGFAV